MPPLQHAPPSAGFLLSTLAPKWAAVTMKLWTQHWPQVARLHVPHQNSTSTHSRTAFEVLTHRWQTDDQGPHTVLGIKISHRHDYISCATLGHFEVEHVDMTLRYNVQYRGSLLGLPILVPEWSKRDQLGREARQRGWKFGFFRGQTCMKWTETFTLWSQPPGPPFPLCYTHQILLHYALPCKTPLSRPKVARFCQGVKKVQQGASGWQYNM